MYDSRHRRFNRRQRQLSSTCAAALCLAPLICINAWADDGADGLTWGIGFGGIAEDDGYLDVGAETNVLPVLYIETESFTFLGYSFDWILKEGDIGELSLVGGYRFDGYESGESDALDGMDDRDGTLDVGFAYRLETTAGEFELAVTHDALSTHNGYHLTLGYGKSFRIGSGGIKPYVEYAYMSDDLANYYYGVKASEAIEGRPRYEVGAAHNYTVGVDSLWTFGQHHNLKFDLSYTVFDSVIGDSPIMERDDNPQVIFGYWYTF